jgi:hypothetical protein
MRVARYEVPGKIRKSGPSRKGRLIRSFPLVCLPQRGYCWQCSHLVSRWGWLLKASAAALMMFVSSYRFSERGT